ncbi:MULTISPECIES: energy-coupling factor ABC transporter ATP-binding protein [Thalassospira]|uniref:Cobalt ABC transporter ATP-binding protein n=2 Tax=Thalassospira TaxID=168934 RepID=A0A367WCE9_9PROT|nr:MULTISPECIES: ATP-binding cassette domain-containing protein [Thalassospira]MDG4717396.1 ATP-binding cassette domain-containing protein [Thalassospira sp. FZY0004]RCK39125.1 cobalt ABC transporter ATP-binding protein [Thalassospira profundimaris]
MIRFENVSVQFDARRALEGIDITLGEKRIGIIGANGSGKSTFVRLLNGLQTATGGRVLVDDLDPAKDGRKVRRHVGFVFQNPDNQIVYPVVEEDLAFGLKALKLPKDEINRRIDEILARYDLSAFKTHPSHLLSGGQKQLLAISGVLVMEPRYIVLDEPTTLLDLRNRNRVERAIADLDQTVITVSHDLDLIAGYDRVLVFENGKIVVDDIPAKAIAIYREMMA